MNLYVVRNRDGQFFRAKGFGGGGESWVKELEKAKFYAKLGQAKSRVTFFTKEYPKYGCPDILEFTLDVSTAKVMDMAATTQKAITKIAKRALDQEKRQNEREVELLRIQREQIEQRIKKLT